jgi:dihydroxyacetone kinase-like predicted kinase
MGLVDGVLVVVCPGLEEAVETVLDRLDADKAQLITLYRGADVAEDAAGALATRLKARHPAPDLEVVEGGQPLYHYIIAVE